MDSLDNFVAILVGCDVETHYGLISVSPMTADEREDKTLFDKGLLRDEDWSPIIGEITARFLENTNAAAVSLYDTLRDPRQTLWRVSNLEAQQMLRSPRYYVGDETNFVFAGGYEQLDRSAKLLKLMRKRRPFEAPELQQLDLVTSVNWPDEVHYWWPCEPTQPPPDLVRYLDIMDEVLNTRGLCVPAHLRESG